MFAYLLVFLPLLNLSSAVINGTDASRLEFPFMVSLQWDGQHKCGGTLVNGNTILTAAHCYPLVWVDPSQPHRVMALLGNTDRLSRGGLFGARVGIRRIIWPDGFPEWMKSKAIMKAERVPDDYILLKLNHTICQSSFIKSASLSSSEEGKLKPKIGDICTPIGWGRSKYPDVNNITAQIFPQYLQKGLARIVKDQECWNRPDEVGNMLCARQVIAGGHPRGIVCFGDSGSPLVCENRSGKRYVAGIAKAAVVPCNHPNEPTVFTRVSAIRRWIEEHL